LVAVNSLWPYYHTSALSGSQLPLADYLVHNTYCIIRP
jgi:hypothetical protein